MRIGIIGAGRIGGNAARLFARAGHDVLLSFSRDPEKLRALARAIGERASDGSPAEAARYGEVVMLSVPWTAIDEALAAAGPLTGKIVIDTTNQFGADGLEKLPDEKSAAEVNAERMPGWRLVKSYNTLTAGFQAEAAGRGEADRVAMFLAGEDPRRSASSPVASPTAGSSPSTSAVGPRFGSWRRRVARVPYTGRNTARLPRARLPTQ